MGSKLIPFDLPPAEKGRSIPSHLLGMIPTEENAADLRSKILAIIHTLRVSPSEDYESLAHDIFVEAFISHTPITFVFVRHRVINRFHATRIYNNTLRSSSTSLPSSVNLPSLDHLDLLTKLLSMTSPTSDEINVIACLFNLGLTHAETAFRLRRSEFWVKQTIFGVLERLRKAGRILASTTKGGGE